MTVRVEANLSLFYVYNAGVIPSDDARTNISGPGGSAACCCVLTLDHDNHHVQDCSDKTSPQLYHPCPGKESRIKTPSGGYCD